jgi:hypothetical protein
MSDFLTRTAEAALGAGRVVQPLIASRYAPSLPQLSLEMETVVDHSRAAGLASDAKSNEVAERPRSAALNDSHNVHDQEAESPAGAEDRTARPETTVIRTVTTLPAQAVIGRQDEVASTMQPDEHSAQSTTEQKPVSISTPADDRMSANTKVSIRPTVMVPETVGEPQSQRKAAPVAPLSVRSMSVEAPETQPAAPPAKAAGKSEVNERSASRSLAPADRRDLHDSAAGRGSALVERRLDIDVSEAVREGDPAQRSFNRFSEGAIVITKGNEAGRTDPDSYLNQSLFSMPRGSNSPDNSARRSVAARHVSPSSATSDRGARDSAEPPIIRVTIGRIEVRAAAPPAPPLETVAPPKPKMSLDEYLRQHNGRRP